MRRKASTIGNLIASIVEGLCIDMKVPASRPRRVAQRATLVTGMVNKMRRTFPERCGSHAGVSCRTGAAGGVSWGSRMSAAPAAFNEPPG